MLPVPWKNAVCVPLGAVAAPQALPLPWMPLPPTKLQPTPGPLGVY